MKAFVTATLFAAVVSISAQQTVTVDYWEPCPTTESVVTVTNGVTVTTCPQCTRATSMSTMTATPPMPVWTSIYTTTVTALCSTGYTDSVVTITQTCTGETPSWPTPTNGPPPGMTTTVTVCTVCGPKPTAVTPTVPCEETPSPMPPQPTAPTWQQSPPYSCSTCTTKPMCPGPNCMIPSSDIYPTMSPTRTGGSTTTVTACKSCSHMTSSMIPATTSSMSMYTGAAATNRAALEVLGGIAAAVAVLL
ncbi:hypothetical protein W97_08523 [Coniosporium apollinis CBS 100218]|uniref:Uncharacterized protein n=1 Tax=Coniosporium apollinis (strain CBS 100218) TaxID=1168221 RepID=R7Z4R3_CONA1|nr:uncharacterized protein W97_08523 [Coniosporium apollinis CBS 100218]EON69165.1 hypothetical protein W97_08523 [Coniosporium apollinis CBS 100218]